MIWNPYTKEIVIDENHTALYNYVNDSALFLSNQLFDIVSPYLQKNSFGTIKSKHPQLYDSLLNNGFILTFPNDDGWVHKLLNKKLSSKKTYRLTINPTLDCNLRCWYCYQNHTKNCYMNSEVQSSALRFAESKISDNELETFRLSFFGGEPLIRVNSISLPIAEKVNILCQRYNKKLFLHFTTNGVLLSDSIIERIKAICTDTSLQIPFDGGREYHNITKKSSVGAGMYDVTLNNIYKAAKKGLYINVRCNYTLKNIDSFEELVSTIRENTKEYKHLISFSLQKVWQEKPSIELDEKAKRISNIINEDITNSSAFSLGLPASFCYADYEESLVINYDGALYKCTARDFTKENKIGDLASDGSLNIYSDKYKQNKRYNKECQTCSILPICTICTQARVEALRKDVCPVEITEDDKQRQIVTRFQTIYGKSLIRQEK